MGQLESASMNFKHNNTTLNMYTTRLLEHVIGKTYNRGMYVHIRDVDSFLNPGGLAVV